LSTAAAALPTSVPYAGEPRVATFKAPLLSRILDSGDPERREVVLDLGGPCQPLIDRLISTRRLRVEIADLVAERGLPVLAGIAASEDPDAVYESRIRSVLPRVGDEPLDLILCWDLPNYLPPKVLRYFFDVLSLRAAPGCKLHMLIAYSKREMPAAPGRYVPQADGQLTHFCSDSMTSKAPRYSPEELGLVVGNFRYERGVLLANGMQEFVYAWPGGPVAKSRTRR
jgi:hypothetical protein